MKNIVLPVVFVLSTTILLTGCETIQQLASPKVERIVVDNNLISDKYPKAVVSIDKNLDYIGMVPTSEWVSYSIGSGGAFNNNSGFLFVSSDDSNFLDKMVTVNFWEISKGYWIPGFKKDENIKIDKTKIGNYRFDTGIYMNSVSRNSKSAEFVENEGYLLPSCMIYKGYKKLFSSGRFENKKLYISYAEPIDCDDSVKFLPENINTKSSKKILDEFNARAEASFKLTSM